jgi:hypothetical protein
MRTTRKPEQPKARGRRRSVRGSIEWKQRLLSLRWIAEPNLVFAQRGKSTDPKEGLGLYGPYGLSVDEHQETVRVGFVGTETTIGQAKAWLRRCSGFIAGEEGKRRQAPDFPGFNRDTAFSSEFVFNRDWESSISQREMAQVITAKDKLLGFESAVDLFASKAQLVSELHPTDIIICALPEDIENYYSSLGPEEVRGGASTQASRFARAIRRVIREAEAQGQESFLRQLFPDEASAGPGLLSRNFRRALKAKANRSNCPLQILRQRSLVEDDPSAQDAASRAWNMVVGLYFKARGRPWQVEGLDPDTCYIGISFYHHITEESHTVHSSLAQLFSTHGDSLVLRGQKFEWDEAQLGCSPHLSEDHALDLISDVLKTYYASKGITPRRVVVHKTSKFWDDERRGFESGFAQANISQHDLISLDQSAVRFFREGDYPPIRGTWAHLAGVANWLYTLGYLPTQGTYPRPHVPKPLQIVDMHGDSTVEIGRAHV